MQTSRNLARSNSSYPETIKRKKFIFTTTKTTMLMSQEMCGLLNVACIPMYLHDKGQRKIPKSGKDIGVSTVVVIWS